MSDIDINLSGLLALVTFLLSAAGCAVTFFVCLVVAFVKASKAERSVGKQRVFAYVISAALLLVANLIAFSIFFGILDATNRDTKNVVDTLAMFAWAPLQPILWIATGMIVNKTRKI